ncbi:hypothetical protein [Streptomyces sp. NPDC002521]
MTASTTAVSLQGGSWVQTGPLSFNHALTGADGAYEQIAEVPGLTIPYAGLWEVSYDTQLSFGLQASASAALFIHTALFNNGVVIPSSESLTGYQTNAGLGVQVPASKTFLHTFAVQDTVTLQAFRKGPSASGTSIYSSGDGRTGVMAHWVSPGF